MSCEQVFYEQKPTQEALEVSFERELDPEWKETISAGIIMLLENYDDVFGYKIVNGKEAIVPLYFDPRSYSDDHRSLHQLNPTERDFIVHTFFTYLEFDPRQAKREKDPYTFDSPQSDSNNPVSWWGTAVVYTYDLQSEEYRKRNMYLHQIIYPDTRIDGSAKFDYLIAPKEYII